MTATTSVNAAGNLYEQINQGGAGKTKSEVEQTQDRFLKLLITQLKSQDPMNPMDSAQSTSQMAQINTVTGIQQLNEAMKEMSATFQAGLSVQAAAMAAGLVGRDVMAVGDRISLDADSEVPFEVTVPDKANDVRIAIYNAGGAKVDEIELGKQKPGMQQVSWDGLGSNGQRLPPGTYRIEAVDVDSTNKVTALPTSVRTRVESVSVAGGSILLNLAGGRTMPFGDVNRIL